MAASSNQPPPSYEEVSRKTSIGHTVIQTLNHLLIFLLINSSSPHFLIPFSSSPLPSTGHQSRRTTSDLFISLRPGAGGAQERENPAGSNQETDHHPAGHHRSSDPNLIHAVDTVHHDPGRRIQSG